MVSRPRASAVAPIALLALAACDPSAPVDGGPGDAPADGRTDAPFVRADAGPPGAALAPTDPCDDLVDDLYATPAGLPPFDASVRGALLGCAAVGTISAAELATRLGAAPGIETTGGAVRVYVVAYRTEREPRGVGGISTALVYLPDVARSERVPLVLVAHGTVGVADACAPSRFVREGLDVVDLPADYVDALLLPYAAAGLPVIAPDYAGLGTEGTHGYGNWPDSARSALDGVRALSRLLPPERLDGGTLVFGHSQGGGIAIAAAALASETPDVDLRAIVASAPGYDVAPATTLVRLSSFVLDPVLRATGALYAYADYANLVPEEARWGEPFPASIRDRVTSELSTHCFVEAGTALATPAPGYDPPTTIGELFDPAFTDAVGACVDGGACDGAPGAWVARDAANQPVVPPDGPPILVLGSTSDTVNAPGVLGCVVTRLRTDGTDFETCMVEAGDHLPMVAATAGHAIDWSIAVSTGASPPACPGATAAPRCSLF